MYCIVCVQDEVLAALAMHHDGAKVPLRWIMLGDEHKERVTTLTVDRKWFSMTVRSRLLYCSHLYLLNSIVWICCCC